MPMRYWQTYQKDLIQKYLNLVFKDQYDFTLWQQDHDYRRQYAAKFLSNEKDRCKLKIAKSSIDKNGPLIKEKPIYIHIPKLDIIFKKEQFNHFINDLDFPPPVEIQVYERRKQNRFYYRYQDHKNITFYSSHVDLNTKEPEYRYSCVLIDISVSGAGIIIPKEIKDQIYNDEYIYLQNITDQKLPNPFKVFIRYLEPYYVETGMELFKLGIEFDKDLDAISYKSITSIVEVKQMKARGIDPKRFCGLTYEEQVRTLNLIELTNKQLSLNIGDNIDYLDRLRYLTTKMKIEFLQETHLDLLATALRLSSKELIYELLIELTENMQNDFLEKLANEKPASAICKAQDKIIEFIRKKEATGEYILDPTSFTTYV